MTRTSAGVERDRGRSERNRVGYRDAGLGAVVYTRPSQVLLLSGYRPATGTALAVVTADGGVGPVVPEDEGRMAQGSSWADEVRCFEPGSLERLDSVWLGASHELKQVAYRGALELSGVN